MWWLLDENILFVYRKIMVWCTLLWIVFIFNVCFKLLSVTLKEEILFQTWTPLNLMRELRNRKTDKGVFEGRTIA